MSETKEVAAPPRVKSFQPITKVKSLQELFDHPGLKDRMEAIVPRHLDANRLLRTFMNATLKTPGLAKASPMSMLGCAMTVGYLGLEPNTPLGLMYLIPFEVNEYNRAKKTWDHVRTDVQPIIGYEGYLDLIARGGFVKDIDCQLIWAGDVWENERGSNRHFRHVEKHAPRAETDEPEYAYMFARTNNGGEYLELMSRADVHRIRGMSQGYRTAISSRDEAAQKGWRVPKSYTEAPWIKHAAAMWRKTPLRQGQKFIPGRTPELALAAQLDDAGDAGRVRFDNVIDVEAVTEGAWEVPADQSEAPPEADRPSMSPPATAARAPAGPTETHTGSGTPRAPRKAPARQAAQPDTGEPPPGFDDNAPPDDRWEPPGPETVARAGQTGAAAPAATAPAPAEASPGASAGPVGPTGLAFEEWLLDFTGDVVGEEPFGDPVTFAQEAVASWAYVDKEFPLSLSAWMEHNAGAIENARQASGQARDILSAVTDGQTSDGGDPLAEEESDPTAATVVELPMDRGKPAASLYIKAFKVAAGELSVDNWANFIDLNKSTMLRCEPSTCSLLLKALVERAKVIGATVPPDLAPSLLQRGKAAAPSPGSTPAHIESKPAEDADWQTARNRLAELRGCANLHEFEAMGRGIVVKNFVERLDREGKTDIAAWLRGEAEKKRQELKGGV